MLPKGATALDWRFSIHTDIGYHCTAVKVKQPLVPMGYKLRNGDQVQVLTNKNQKPNESWLKMVVTGKARSKIRSAMKEERRKQGEFGKEGLERKLKNMKVDYEQGVEVLVKYFGFKSHVDFHYAIAMEEISLSDELKAFRVEAGKLIHEVPKKPAPAPVVEEQAVISDRRSRKKVLGKPQLQIGGEPADQYDYHFATCCNPVQGDDIFAYLTATAGLKIHRANCPNATHLMANYGYRIMKAEWVMTTNTTFVADLKLTGIDKGPGIIERLTHEISSNLGVNIRSLSISGDEGYYEGKISLLVANTDQLNLAIKKLQNLDDVSTVTRIE
jgi:guanosine-3',5'-bis(diphosphate) 3'-pyrophosphohydrolase